MFRRYWVPILLLLFDAAVILTVPFLSLLLRFEGDVDPRYFSKLFPYLPWILGLRLVSFYLFKLYHRMWRYASIHELIAIIGAVTVSTIIIASMMIITESGIPRSVHLLSWLLLIAFIGLSRLALRIYYYFRFRMMSPRVNVLIIGAGDAGAMLAKEIRNHDAGVRRAVGFVDDDPTKWGQQLLGIPVLGGRDSIPKLVELHQVAEIMIAIPSAPGSAVRSLVEHCRNTGCVVKILPGLTDLIDGRVSLNNLRKVDLEDLLRREPIRLDNQAIKKYLQDKRIMVTGAGGSIGAELCRQLIRFSPAAIYLLGKGENSIYDIHGELCHLPGAAEVVPIIADIRDESRIREIFRHCNPQVVFHAAAHKHVPLMEMQPVEAVRNNVLGTMVMARAASEFSVDAFVMISTDKAVNPTSVMGATKRIAERVIQRYSQQGSVCFSAVRFGNVLGSRGSVVPLFKKQIAGGGPVTVTDPNMKRYFMTIPEAAQLVLQAGSMANNGEVFVLDMGEPVRIVDMAEDLIRLSGLEPYEDIEIVFTQTRPGEKLFEELLTAEEGTSATCHEKIFRANLRQVESVEFDGQLQYLLAQNEPTDVKQAIQQLVPTYNPHEAQKH